MVLLEVCSSLLSRWLYAFSLVVDNIEDELEVHFSCVFLLVMLANSPTSDTIVSNIYSVEDVKLLHKNFFDINREILFVEWNRTE